MKNFINKTIKTVDKVIEGVIMISFVYCTFIMLTYSNKKNEKCNEK